MAEVCWFLVFGGNSSAELLGENSVCIDVAAPKTSCRGFNPETFMIIRSR